MMCTDYDEGYTHQGEQPPTLLVVFTGDLDCASREPVHILCRASLLGLLSLLLGLFSPLKTF